MINHFRFGGGKKKQRYITPEKKVEAPLTPLEIIHVENADRRPIWTVCRTSDDPEEFVARMSFTKPKILQTDYFIAGKTLESVRAQLPRKLFWQPRRSDDDRMIVEVWL
jgi:hypothetical protein